MFLFYDEFWFQLLLVFFIIFFSVSGIFFINREKFLFSLMKASSAATLSHHFSFSNNQTSGIYNQYILITLVLVESLG